MLRLVNKSLTRALVCINFQRGIVETHKSISSSLSSTVIRNLNFNSFSSNNLAFSRWVDPAINNSLLSPKTNPVALPVRTLTKFSLQTGKRKSVKAVLKRFKRLDWGMWVRTHSGRNKKLFKKSPALKRRLRQHVFTNATQSWLLDKMVTSFWRRPKYYINDPYESYHKRDEYYATKRKTLKV